MVGEAGDRGRSLQGADAVACRWPIKQPQQTQQLRGWPFAKALREGLHDPAGIAALIVGDFEVWNFTGVAYVMTSMPRR